MTRYVKWLFWTVVYFFTPHSKDFDKAMTRLLRTRNPWWKFKPFIYHSDDGNMWQIYLEDEAHYVERRTLTLECHVGQESGRIVGFDIWDETLERKES